MPGLHPAVVQQTARSPGSWVFPEGLPDALGSFGLTQSDQDLGFLRTILDSVVLHLRNAYSPGKTWIASHCGRAL